MSLLHFSEAVIGFRAPARRDSQVETSNYRSIGDLRHGLMVSTRRLPPCGHDGRFLILNAPLRTLLRAGDHMEIITGVERRRRWRLEEKLRLVAECDAPRRQRYAGLAPA